MESLPVPPDTALPYLEYNENISAFPLNTAFPAPANYD